MTLTAALALVAVLVLAALAAHGLWRTWQAQPRRAAIGDEAAPAARIEPSLGEAPAGVDADAAPSLPAALPATPPRREPRIDALIDAIAPLTLEAPVSGEMLIAHLPPSRRAGAKPLYVEGLNAARGDWEAPLPGQRYRELQAAVQLANRSGALNEIEYSEFVQKVQRLADALGALPEFPDMLDVVARARELDAFASPHDATLTVVLRANSVAWSVGYVQQCAQRHGFVVGTLPGRLVMPADEDGAPPVLTLSFDAQAALADDAALAAVRELTLSLEVAHTSESAEPFAAWHNAIRSLAEAMDASAVDDSGRPITLHHFATIAEELKTLYRALEARDMAAGSALARRLFQ